MKKSFKTNLFYTLLPFLKKFIVTISLQDVLPPSPAYPETPGKFSRDYLGKNRRWETEKST